MTSTGSDLDRARLALQRIGVENVMQLQEDQVGGLVSSIFGTLTTIASSLAAAIAHCNARGRTAKGSDRAALAVLFRAFADVVEHDTETPIEELVAALASEAAP